MSTTVINDDRLGVLRPGLSPDDLRAGDSISNTTTSTWSSRGSRSLLAKAQAKKAALIAKQRRQAERVALEQQKLQVEEKLEQHKARTRAQCKLLALQSEALQLQTDIEEQDALEQVYQNHQELTDRQFHTSETRRSAQVSEAQSQIHVDNEPVHDVNAPTATNVSMRQKQVTIFEDVIDSGQHSARVDSHVSSSASTGEANWEQHLSNHYRGDAVTSAGATTPNNDTTGDPRQIYAPPTTTCGA